MVRELLERIAAPVRGLHQAAYWLAALTLASQVLALLRDRTFAHAFGAGETLDLYYAAFRVPDLMFAIVSSLVSAYILIPRITGADRETTRRLLSESMTFLLVLGGALCVILALYMPGFLTLLYPDLSNSVYREEFILLARVLLIQPIILGVSGILASVTQVNRRFVLFALSPVLYNLGIIFGAIVLYPLWGLPGIGAGVVLGALAYATLNIPVVMRAGVLPRLVWPTWSTMLPIVRDSVPRSLALGMGAITLLVLTSLASRIGDGAVSVFTFASNLEAVPLALIGSSYAVAAFPALSEYALKNKDEFARILSASARHIILWSVVFVGIIAVLRAHLVRVILGTGAFDWDDTRLTAALLAMLVAGLVAQGLVLLFSRALYAARKSWEPLIYQLASCALTIGLALLLLAYPQGSLALYLAELFKVSDVSGNSVLLIAFAAMVGQLFLAGLSLVGVARVAPGVLRGLMQPLFGGLLAAVTGGVATYGMLAYLGEIAPLTTLFNVFTEGFIAGMVGLAASALTLYLIGNEEFKDIVSALHRLARPRVILSPSAEEPAKS